MKIKHTNKFFALLLAILMVAAIVPLSAITTSAADDTVIDTITITDVIEPVAGQIPANTTFTLAQSDKVDVDLNYVGYSQETVFEAGKVYSYYIYLTPKTGYSFSNPVHATINGMEAHATKLGANLLVQLNYICASGTKTAVNSIDLSWFVPPVYGETPSVTPLKVPDGAGYWTSTVYWKKDSTSFSGTFDYGTYKVEIPVYTNDGFEFVGAPTATVNGMPAKVIPQTAEYVIVSLDCTVTTEKINEVDLYWFVPPVAGETPSVIPLKTPDDGGYTSGSVYWYKDGTAFDGTFGYDTYTVKIPVVAKEGYEFLYTTTAKINNMPATVEVDDATHIWVSMECTVATEKINEVDLIWFVPPVAGETPSVIPLKTPDDGGYISGSVYWYKDGTAFDGAFTPGDTYKVKIPVVAKEGYEFLYNATAKINNMPATVEVDDATHIWVSIECTLSNQIDKVEIYGVTEPLTGNDINYLPPTTPIGDGYFAGNVYWYKNDSPFEGAFELGQTYKAEIPIVANDGYEFKAGATATVNGKDATVTVIDATHILVSIEYTVEAIKISTIDISDVVEPVSGQTPTTTAPTVSFLNVLEMSWYKNGEAFSGKFEAGHKYTAKIVVSPKEAVEILDTLTATVNNQIATVTKDGGNAIITIEFIALASSESGTTPGTTPGTDDPNTSDDPNTPDDPDKKDGLGAGAIIGIVVGVLAVLGGGGFALYWFVLRKKPILPRNGK